MRKTIPKEEFNEWLDSYITLYFMDYLMDSIKDESTQLAEGIASGGIFTEAEQVGIAATCATLQRIAEINYDEIEDFYREGEEDGSFREQGSN